MSKEVLWEKLKGMVDEETLMIMKQLESDEKENSNKKKSIKNVEVKISDLSNVELKINNKAVQERYEQNKHKLSSSDKNEIQNLLRLFPELNAMESTSERRAWLNRMSKKELINYYNNPNSNISSKSKSDIIEVIINTKSYNDRTISMIIATVY